MKNTFKTVLIILISLFVGSIYNTQVFADVNDFYFSDFDADYYLYKDSEGISHLKVVENVTAVFPTFKQNKGICRQIPFTNQNNQNVTLKNLTRDKIKVYRNELVEPIYSIEKEDNYYNVCTGTDEYVLGEQKYRFEYEFEKVVTEFSGYQELYWDTNGNGSLQRFDKVTARLHFEDMDVWSGKKWCYVGRYGDSGQERCTILEISDGVEFSAVSLSRAENLTFDVELKKGSFTIPEPEVDYIYVYLAIVFGALCLVVVIWRVKKYYSSRGKAEYYKGLFVKPEYQPSKDYSLAEMAELYIGKKKDIKVAMLLEMVVSKKIEFRKNEKRKWSIIVKDLNGIREEGITLLKILNDGEEPVVGSEILLKRRSAKSSLISLRKTMETKITKDLKDDGLVESKYNFGFSKSGGDAASTMIANIIAMAFLVFPMSTFLVGSVTALFGLEETYGKIMVFEVGFFLAVPIMIFATSLVWMILNSLVKKYSNHTNKGLEASRYMDGLRLYIEMAEADRMKMLQSVEGADTSAEGIVKLYEKLLPYAAVFGLEESWMNEMKEYCQVEDIEEPDYLLNGIAISEISRSLRNAASIATTSSTMSSSGGGSSSGFSGGGGGGFSGGGGGGGGFGGR